MEDMFTSKEKDEVLEMSDGKDRQIHINTFTDEGRRLKEIVESLADEGYVYAARYKGGITFWTTDKGMVLKSKGGFFGIEKKKSIVARKEKIKNYFWRGLFFFLGVLVSKLIDILLPLLIHK